MPSVYIKTYGCQMNERDSEQVARSLVMRGYRVVLDETQADVILLNTCSVRDAAEQKAVGKMGVASAAPRKATASRSWLSRLHGPESRRRTAKILARRSVARNAEIFHRVADYVDELLRRRLYSRIDDERLPSSMSRKRPIPSQRFANTSCRRRRLPRLFRSCRGAICAAPFASSCKLAVPNAGVRFPKLWTRSTPGGERGQGGYAPWPDRQSLWTARVRKA